MRGRGGQWRVKSGDEEDAVAGSTASAIPQPTAQQPQTFQQQPTSAPHNTKPNKPDDTSKRHSEKGPRDKKPPRDDRRRRDNKLSEADPNAKQQSEAEKIKAEEEKKRKEEEEQKRWVKENLIDPKLMINIFFF